MVAMGRGRRPSTFFFAHGLSNMLYGTTWRGTHKLSQRLFLDGIDCCSDGGEEALEADDAPLRTNLWVIVPSR